MNVVDRSNWLLWFFNFVANLLAMVVITRVTDSWWTWDMLIIVLSVGFVGTVSSLRGAFAQAVRQGTLDKHREEGR